MAKRKESSPGWRRFWDDEDMAQDQPQAEEFGTPAEPESQEASAEDVSGDLLSSIRKINRRKLKSKKTKKQMPTMEMLQNCYRRRKRKS